MLNGFFKRMLGRDTTPAGPALAPRSDEWASLELDPELSAPKAVRAAPVLADVALQVGPIPVAHDDGAESETSSLSFALMDMKAAEGDQLGGAGVSLDAVALAAIPDSGAVTASAAAPAEVKVTRKTKRRADAPAGATKPRRRQAVDFRAAWALPGPNHVAIHNDAVEHVSLEGLSALAGH